MLELMIVAGEASGDFYGANLIKALKEYTPEAKFFGFGSTLMQNEGLEIIFDPTHIGALGFTEVIKVLGFFKGWLKKLEKILVERRPNCLILIDFPGFNLRLASIAKRHGIPVVYFIPPSAWAWGGSRAKKVAKNVDRVASIIPMDFEVYTNAGANITMVGHPLTQDIPVAIDREEACRLLGLDHSKPVLTLLPGSRNQEIDTHLIPMLKACKVLQEENNDLQITLGLSQTIKREKVEAIFNEVGLWPVVVEGHTHQAIAASTASLCIGGTVTLEVALLERPMVVCYKLSSISFLLVKLLANVKYYTLPNLVLDKRAVIELIQRDFTVENMVFYLRPLLSSPEPNLEAQKVLYGIRNKLGNGDAYKNTAKIVLEVVSNASGNNIK